MTNSGICISILLAAPPGIMRSSLRSYLRTIPTVSIVAQVSVCEGISPTLTRHHPHLLLLDADMPNLELASLLQHVCRKIPDLDVIVLVRSQDQQRIALDAGARDALLKGCLDQQLRQAILAPHKPQQ